MSAAGNKGRRLTVRWALGALAAFTGLMLASNPAAAQGQDPAAQRQAVSAGQVLVQGKQYRAAIELIKPYEPQLSSSPEARDMTLLLAAGYLGESNALWAIRTLGPRIEADAKVDSTPSLLIDGRPYVYEVKLEPILDVLQEAADAPGAGKK